MNQQTVAADIAISDLRRERDEARHVAAVLAHAYEVHNTPPAGVLKLANEWLVDRHLVCPHCQRSTRSIACQKQQS